MKFIRIIAIFCLLLMSMRSSAQTPVRLILDTDIESDVDDVGTVAVLHALADRGEVNLLGMMVSVKHPWSVPCLDALNTYYGRPDIPIGAVKNSIVPDAGSKYARSIAEEFPHDSKWTVDAPDATKLYREILAAEADGSVVIVSVGYLTNMRNLLNTRPDTASPLDGVALVRKKVRVWVCMGAGFPKGHEWNMHRDAASSARAINEWPTPIIFSGFEVGVKVNTGRCMAETPQSNPVRRAYQLFNGLEDRHSWDQTAALFAVRGLDGGLADYWTIHRGGVCRVAPDGRNDWKDVEGGTHAYLVEKKPPAEVAAAIEELMVQPRREP